mmetsp:Transcript_900/g.1748  ORF Transcript_900/g.1748 Transcript_900/m.1748 type:complete len:138 (+) Transcript_900:407-820(+)
MACGMWRVGLLLLKLQISKCCHLIMQNHARRKVCDYAHRHPLLWFTQSRQRGTGVHHGSQPQMRFARPSGMSARSQSDWPPPREQPVAAQLKPRPQARSGPPHSRTAISHSVDCRLGPRPERVQLRAVGRACPRPIR